MTAVRNDGIDAAVWYHGADTEKYLGEIDGLRAPILMHIAKRMSSYPRVHKRRLKRRLRRNQMRRCTATWGKIMPSLEITEHTITPLLQHSLTDVQVNSYINICSDLVRHAHAVNIGLLKGHVDELAHKWPKIRRRTLDLRLTPNLLPVE